MKKILFATVAMAAALVMGDAIESQNVVGYNTLDTGYTYQMLGSSFKGIGSGDGCTLGSIVGDFADEDEIQISYMDEDGIIQFTSYQYLTEEGYGMDESGWYNGDYELANDVLLPRGSAVWFVSSGDAKATITSGEVPSDATIHPAFVEQYSMICSAYPIAFNPNASSVSWSGLIDEDEIQVAYVDEDGIIQFTSYQYLTEEGYGMDESGWYNGDYELVSEPIAAVGQGFWLILSDPSGVTMVETSPLAK